MDGNVIDILILAMIAAFLVFRLRSVLGRRTGEEPRPPTDPFSRRSQDGEAEGKVIELPDRASGGEAAAAPDVTPQDPLKAALVQIKIADQAFDEAQFVAGARSAFEMVVHAYATGDTGLLRSLLSEEVFDRFAASIQARAEAGETLETTVIGVKSADIVEARLDGRTAYVTVSFVSEQVNVTRDADGRVIDGDPNQVSQGTDIWTFSRNTRSRDPNWILVATRSSH